MKTRAQVKQARQASVEVNAKNQANEGNILQAYKNGIPQLAEATEPVQRKENKTGLPDNLKSGVENLSGHSLDDVKVHYGSSKPAELQAHAYAQGTDIHVAPGQEKHLPHEAWHVVQQKEGRVRPTKQLKGTTHINDDAGLEAEADVMGAKAMQLKETQSNPLHSKLIGSTIQRAAIPGDIKDHKTDLDEVIDDMRSIIGPKGKTNEPLENTIDGVENWASETMFAAKRKYVEYNRASDAYERGAVNVFLGEDTTLESDIEYSENGEKHWEESKLVSGDWPQFGVNVLAAREQCAGRTRTNGVGIASIALSDDFYENAQKSLGLSKSKVKGRCRNYLDTTMRKKFPSAKKTSFFVRVYFDANESVYEEFDVTKWHR